MKIFKHILLFTVLLSSLKGQQLDQTTVQRQTTPPEQFLKSSNRESQAIVPSNTGILSPILLKTSNITIFGGLDNKFVYKTNPIFRETNLIDKNGGKAGVWTYTLSGGGMINPIDFNSALVTPILGASWSESVYYNNRKLPGGGEIYDSLETYDTNVYALFMIQHESGINFRIGSSYSMAVNVENNTEDYYEFYPNIGATYKYDQGWGLQGIFDISGGAHYAINNNFGDDSKNHTQALSHWDYTLSYSLLYEIFGVSLSPSYRITTKDYFKDTNQVASTYQREDVMQYISLKADYPFLNYFNFGVKYEHSRRNSNVRPSVVPDYRAHDLSTNLSINYTF